MRALLLLLLLAFAAGPQDAAAEEKVWRVGLLSNGPPPSGVTTIWRDEILRALAHDGFAVGKNLQFIERYSEDHPERLPLLAREIDASGADAIVAISDVSIRAALAATKTTPIVMVVGNDPITTGLVASFAHPGGRVTGIYFQVSEGDAKRLELLREAIPSAHRIGYLGWSFDTTRADSMARAAARLGIELMMHWVAGPAEYGSAFAAMKNEGAVGVVVAGSQQLASHSREVAARASENGLPTICEWDYMARVGCVFGFGHDLAYAQYRVGEYVARLGLVMPPLMLARADEVIE